MALRSFRAIKPTTARWNDIPSRQLAEIGRIILRVLRPLVDDRLIQVQHRMILASRLDGVDRAIGKTRDAPRGTR